MEKEGKERTWSVAHDLKVGWKGRVEGGGVKGAGGREGGWGEKGWGVVHRTGGEFGGGRWCVGEGGWCWSVEMAWAVLGLRGV